MAVISARVLTISVAAAAVFATAACGGSEPAAPAQAPADGEIQLVDAPAKSVGLTGDGSAAAGLADTPAAEPPAKWVQLSTNDASIGDIVTEIRGFTLYRFSQDSANPSASTCTGDCAQRWPPVLIRPGGRVFADGIDPSLIGAIRRPDGDVQVTIAGWPVYRSADDTVPGDFNGQGVDGAWFALAPDGEANQTLIASVVAEPAAPDRTQTLTAKQTDAATIIVDDDGATLYVSAEDTTKPPTSNCLDICATLWQPVVAKAGGKVQLKGIDTKRVWWLSRADGTKQVTLDGAPLYRNAADKSTDTIIVSAAQQGWTPAQ